MRFRLLTAFGLALIAWPAGAESPRVPVSAGVRPTSDHVIVRLALPNPTAVSSPVGRDSATAPQLAAATALEPYPSAARTPSFDEAQACRQTCAESYYFCAAGAAAEACPSSWSQCAAGCEAVDLTGGIASTR